MSQLRLFCATGALLSALLISSGAIADDCGDCCSGCCDCCCGPLWTVEAGATLLDRARPDTSVLLEDTVSGDELFNAEDFDFNWAAGVDVGVTRHFGPCNGLEIRYFGCDSSQASETFTTSAIWNFPTDPPLFGLGVADVNAVYDASLHSTEVNWRHRTAERIEWLAGFRWIELSEELNFDCDFGGNQADVNWDTNNHLYGVQGGADVVLLDRGGRFTIDGLFKAGVYGNAADNVFGVQQEIGPAFTSRGRAGQVAFAGEVGITGVYRLTDCVALRGGYQLLWLEGVAVASDQAAETDVLAATGIETHGGVLYHGALLGLDFTW